MMCCEIVILHWVETLQSHNHYCIGNSKPLLLECCSTSMCATSKLENIWMVTWIRHILLMQKIRRWPSRTNTWNLRLLLHSSIGCSCPGMLVNSTCNWQRTKIIKYLLNQLVPENVLLMKLAESVTLCASNSL
jgi:hypothetical protein